MAVKTEPVDAPLPLPPDAKANTKLKAKAHAHTPEPPASEKAKATAALWGHRKASAWAVHRWPLERRVVHTRTRLHLPRDYGAGGGVDVVTAWPGECLNQRVWRWYAGRPGEEERDGDKAKGREGVKGKEEGREGEDRRVNFVADHGITARRHEFLGPDPRVAGFFFDRAGAAHVRFYDAFLGVCWMDRTRWEFAVQWAPEEGGRWVEKED